MKDYLDSINEQAVEMQKNGLTPVAVVWSIKHRRYYVVDRLPASRPTGISYVTPAGPLFLYSEPSQDDWRAFAESRAALKAHKSAQ